jgi:hypothetical protein
VSLRYALLATEGPHDQAVIGRLLELLGLKKFNGKLDALQPFWKNFIPGYPRNGNLYARLNMPSLFIPQQYSVAVYHDEGKDNLLENLMVAIASYESRAQDFYAFGLIVDADKKEPAKVAKAYISKLKEYADVLEVNVPFISDVPGRINEGVPRTGIYVLPNNAKTGVLDNILLDCASIVYPEHKRGAEQFLDSLNTAHKSHWKPFDHQKAIVASVVSVLKPGMANTSSIAQDRWICEQTAISVAEVAMLKQFLQNLLELPTS